MSNPLTIAAIIVIGLFVGYLAIRLFSSAFFKSYFEAKKQHNNRKESNDAEEK